MESNSPQQPILVTGGTGKTGRRVAQRLQARGVATHIGSRSGEPPFDWNDETTWKPALEGVKAAYISYYPDLAFPGATEIVGSFAELAANTGVQRLVLLSGRGEDAALAGEHAVQAAGADTTVVRSAFFHQNFSEHFLLEPVLAGVIALPAGEVTEPFVDADDIADVAVAALTEDGHSGQVYEVTGPRLLSFGDVARELTEVIGREIQYISVSSEEYAAMAAEHGVPAEEVEALVGLFSEVLDGHNSYLTDGVQRALGRAPRDFRDYARDAAASGAWSVDR